MFQLIGLSLFITLMLVINYFIFLRKRHRPTDEFGQPMSLWEAFSLPLSYNNSNED